MNRIILLIGICVLFTCCTLQKTRKKNIDIEVNIIEKLDYKIFQHLEGPVYSINIDLFNNTDSVVYFWAMSCSWEMNWRSSTKAFYLISLGCDSNSPILNQIEPGKKFTYKGIACVNENLTDKSDVRLGFLLIKKNDFTRGSDFLKVLASKFKEPKNIIWSEPIKFDK